MAKTKQYNFINMLLLAPMFAKVLLKIPFIAIRRLLGLGSIFNSVSLREEIAIMALRNLLSMPLESIRFLSDMGSDDNRSKIPHQELSHPNFRAILYGNGNDKRNSSELTPEEVAESIVLLWIHGGGNAIGSPFSHAHVFDHWTKLAADHNKKLLIIVPFYPLSMPDSDCFGNYESQVERIKAVWHWLNEKVPAERVALGGDSAGGCLAYSLALRLVAEDLPQPRSIITVSPRVDATNYSHENFEFDITPHDLTAKFIALLGGADFVGKQLPANATDAELQKITSKSYIWVGDKEELFAQIKEFSERLNRLNPGSVNLDIGKFNAHVWPLLYDFYGETSFAAARKIEEIVEALMYIPIVQFSDVTCIPPSTRT